MVLLISSSSQFLNSSPCRDRPQIEEMHCEAFCIARGVCGEVLLLRKSTACKSWSTACPAQRFLIVSLFCQASLSPTLLHSDSPFVMCQVCHLKMKCSRQFIQTPLIRAKVYHAKSIIFVSHSQDNKKAKTSNYTLGEPQTFLWLAHRSQQLC